MWLHKRRKYADTTPWILDELIQTSRDLPEGWDRNGLQANQPMVTDFLAELRAQRLTEAQHVAGGTVRPRLTFLNIQGDFT